MGGEAADCVAEVEHVAGVADDDFLGAAGADGLVYPAQADGRFDAVDPADAAACVEVGGVDVDHDG
ncbi:hypothetical protein E3O21_11750, partial [Cryobacterium flavum]